MAAALGITMVLAPPASANGTTPGTYTYYSWSGVSHLSSVTFSTTVLNDPGRANVYWAHQFALSDGSSGYVGMQRLRGGGGTYLFSLWDAGAAQAGDSGTYCQTFEEGGTGYTCRLSAAFPAGHTILSVIASTGSGWYKATIRDATAGTSFDLGSLRVGTDATIETTNMIDWTEYFDWSNSAATCADEPYSTAFFGRPTGVDASGGGSVTAASSSPVRSTNCQSATAVAVGSTGSLQSDGIGNSASGDITGPGGMCVDVTGAASTDGARLQLYPCSGGNFQNWVLAGDGTVHALFKCMDVSGGGTADGTAVQLYTCNGTAAQKWTLSNGTLVNPQSGKCLDATGGSAASGTKLQLYTCNGTAAQKWTTPTWSAS
ncbi:ricin-type beta-trefoil lectin domain protein [Streptomyces sp. NPDC060000]|uniref:ricin-type beta-trefoil lectin domain protein n=1 Tax=Streptomyces sp. NPDC060000 TaxID=3347031 RepID=UPI0036C9AB01